MLKQISIATCLALSISILASCASSEKNLMEERAAYDIRTPPMLLPSEKNGKAVAYIPVRVPKRVVLAWLHGHELPSKDYFQGGWLSVLVSNETWEMKPVELPRENKKASNSPKTKKTI